MAATVDGLRGLIEEYTASIELGLHGEVSYRGTTIRRKLVELYDEYLLAKTNDPDEGSSPLSSALSSICEKLRNQARVAAIYNDIVEFVRVKVGSNNHHSKN